VGQGGARTVDVTIRIEKGRARDLDEVVRALEASGLTGTERHDRFLIVNGSVDAEKLEALKRVAGVASVREDRVYRAQ